MNNLETSTAGGDEKKPTGTVLPELTHGLQNIALSFSGGGFRAASFCLGCFSYLENIGLGKAKLSALVKFISSASGGSFTSMAIVHAQRQGLGFDDAYQTLFNALNGDELLQKAHEVLKNKSIWKNDRPTKDRNFINAFAMAYDEIVFKENDKRNFKQSDEIISKQGGEMISTKSFQLFCSPAPAGTVTEICVNVTDFTHGQQFRFQHNGQKDYKGKFGNNYLRLKIDTLKKGEKETPEQKAEREKNNAARWQQIQQIKLGDILAASSCFPGGFEPIMFPNDFAWKDKKSDTSLTTEVLMNAIVADDSFINQKPLKKNKKSKKPVYGFMDGGIVDNQGIDAFTHAEARMKTSQINAQKKTLETEVKEKLDQAPDISKDGEELLKKEYIDKRTKVYGYGYDMFAACDVSSNYTSEYNYPIQDSKNWLLKPSLLLYGIFIVVALILASIGIYINVWTVPAYIVLGAFGFPVAAGLLLLFLKTIKVLPKLFGKQKAKPAKKTFTQLFGSHVWYFLNLPLSKVINLLMARILSLKNLALVLFLKKIRQNAYSAHINSCPDKDDLENFINDADHSKAISIQNITALKKQLTDNKNWEHQTINPTVYMLATKNRKHLDTDMRGDSWENAGLTVNQDGIATSLFTVLQPSNAITSVADIGTKMDTTLWFDDNNIQENMRAALIACGQFSMCHSLIRFVHRFSNNNADWVKLQTDLLAHWQQFQIDPYWLYNQVGETHKVNGKPLKDFQLMPK